MVKHSIYVEVPALEDVLEAPFYCKVPVYARGYNIMAMDIVKDAARVAVAKEYAHDNEELYKHILDKGITDKFSIENVEASDTVVDIYGIEELETLEGVRGNYNFF